MSHLAAFAALPISNLQPPYLDLVDDHRQVGELDDGLRDRERQRAQARPEAADENESSDHGFLEGDCETGRQSLTT